MDAQLEDLAEGQRVSGRSRQLLKEVLRNREGFGGLVEELAPGRQARLELLRVEGRSGELHAEALRRRGVVVPRALQFCLPETEGALVLDLCEAALVLRRFELLRQALNAKLIPASLGNVL